MFELALVLFVSGPYSRPEDDEEQSRELELTTTTGSKKKSSVQEGGQDGLHIRFAPEVSVRPGTTAVNKVKDERTGGMSGHVDLDCRHGANVGCERAARALGETIKLVVLPFAGRWSMFAFVVLSFHGPRCNAESGSRKHGQACRDGASCMNSTLRAPAYCTRALVQHTRC